jgi:hypothetical protein
MQIRLETTVRRRDLPDRIHFVEVVTTGMKVMCRVCEDRGRFTITREIFEIWKTKHKWYDTVRMFEEIATKKYSIPVEERLNNSNKTGSI